MNLQSAAWLVAVVTGVAGWIGGARSKFGAIGQRRRERRLRTWHGYIPRGMVSSWYVALVEEPQDADRPCGPGGSPGRPERQAGRVRRTRAAPVDQGARDGGARADAGRVRVPG
jgi:hypothetical protein